MTAKDITPEWLKQQKFDVKPPNTVTIDGVHLKELTVHVDGRGEVTELWSQNWASSDGVIVPAHVYQSSTDYGVVKCWHLHEVHTDQFTVTRGKLQVSAVDLREGSPTYLQVNTVILGALKPRYLRLPPGIMHGWKSLAEPETIVVNFQSHVYDPSDEYKFPWNCVLEEVWQPLNG